MWATPVTLSGLTDCVIFDKNELNLLYDAMAILASLLIAFNTQPQCPCYLLMDFSQVARIPDSMFLSKLSVRITEKFTSLIPAYNKAYLPSLIY